MMTNVQKNVIFSEIEDLQNEISSEIEDLQNEILSICCKDTYSNSALQDKILAMENEIKEFKLQEAEFKQEVENLSLELKNKCKLNEKVESKCDELRNIIDECNALKSVTDKIEYMKKTLTALKRILKVQFIKSNTENVLEGFVFNQNNCYVKYFCLDKNDDLVVKDLWKLIGEACNYNSLIK